MANYCKNYKYDKFIVRFCTCNPTNHTWLEEFLCPHFQIIDAISYDCQVTLVEDTGRYEEILRWGAYPNNAPLPCFAMDNQTICLPRWHSLSDELVLFQENSNIFYVLNRDKKEISLLSPNINQKSRLALMRVIRELASSMGIVC